MGWIRTDAEREQLHADQARIVREALDEAPPDAPMHRDGPATAGGDERRLRGIPAIGRGVTGAIPGTDPERAAMRRTQRQEGTETGRTNARR
jgi:hypothetical protein